jgi:hypothetical protein
MRAQRSAVYRAQGAILALLQWSVDRNVPGAGRVVAIVVERERLPSMLPNSLRLRRLYEMTRPVHPLATATSLPAIEIMTPCTAKDLDTVACSVQSARAASLNPVARAVVVAPRRDLSQLAALFDEGVTFLADEDLGLPRTVAAIRELVAPTRQGWVIQQVAKLSVVARSTAAGVLVVDSDTILLEPRVWMSEGQQLLPVVLEYHAPYINHASKCLGDAGRTGRVSWVAHHQLMQPRLVLGMLEHVRQRFPARPSDSDADPVDEGLEAWVRSADYRESSALADYHCYGAFVRNTEPGNGLHSQWGNIAVKRSTISPADLADPGALRDRFPTALSISLHSYLE